MTRIQREFGEILLANYNETAELDVQGSLIKLGGLFLEFKEVLEQQQLLWNYTKECIDSDHDEIEALKARLVVLEAPKAKPKAPIKKPRGGTKK
jgi:hypothetical protein